MSTPTSATTPQPCARCGDTIAPGERMQRGCHWRCYVAAWRERATGGLPRATIGRPVGARGRANHTGRLRSDENRRGVGKGAAV